MTFRSRNIGSQLTNVKWLGWACLIQKMLMSTYQGSFMHSKYLDIRVTEERANG
jgi:hypothetical protein